MVYLNQFTSARSDVKCRFPFIIAEAYVKSMETDAVNLTIGVFEGGFAGMRE